MLSFMVLLVCSSGCLISAAATDGSTCPQGMLDQVLDKLIGDTNIELSDGVKFVRVTAGTATDNDSGRSAKDSILSRIKSFFSDYVLQVKLSDVFQRKQDAVDILRKVLVSLNELKEGNEETSRGKGGFGGGKKGGGSILVIATMMGGMMAALGYGALGMLVMKALTVSSMALLLSAVIGLRRLFRRPDDDAGFGRISYIPIHTEHRKRRSLQNSPYRAYEKRK